MVLNAKGSVKAQRVPEWVLDTKAHMKALSEIGRMVLVILETEDSIMMILMF